jgi:hypothetical protein
MSSPRPLGPSATPTARTKAPLRVKLLVSKRGERFPVLLADDGMPLFYPTVYEAAMRRQVHLASATLSIDLSAIKFLYTWAALNNVDFEKRFHQGEFLDTSEVQSLANALNHRFDLYYRNPHALQRKATRASKPRKVRSLEAFHQAEPKKVSTSVDRETYGRRLYIVCKYLDWLAGVRTTWATSASRYHDTFELARMRMKESFQSRYPKLALHQQGKREGLSEKQQEVLMGAIAADSPRNPWKDDLTRRRNELLIHLLLAFPTRRGEILQVRIRRDVDTQGNKLYVRRAPDDKADPRRDEPNAKTLERDYDLPHDLAKMLSDYIIDVRSTVRGARFHDFLFVAAKTGEPLSKSGFTKIFSHLRKKIPELPSNLCGHMTKNTWNDNFSKECDDNHIPEEEEMQTREFLNGWKKGSRTAGIYTVRHVRKKAQEANLKMQEKIAKGRKKHEG